MIKITPPFIKLSSSLSILIFDLFFENGQRLTLKSLSTTTTTHPPTIKLFLVSNERYGQINTFLLRYYGTDFASIKRYDQFCLFTVVYKEAQIHPLVTLFILLSLPLPLLPLSLPSLCFLSLYSLLSLCSLFAFSLYSFASFFTYSLPYSQLFMLSLPSLSLFLYSLLIQLSPSFLLCLCSPSFYHLSVSCFGIFLFP